VSYEDIETVPISRALYEKRGYEPPFDTLPTKRNTRHPERRSGSARQVSLGPPQIARPTRRAKPAIKIAKRTISRSVIAP
jgi:hypothetical protein